MVDEFRGMQVIVTVIYLE